MSVEKNVANLLILFLESSGVLLCIKVAWPCNAFHQGNILVNSRGAVKATVAPVFVEWRSIVPLVVCAESLDHSWGWLGYTHHGYGSIRFLRWHPEYMLLHKALYQWLPTLSEIISSSGSRFPMGILPWWAGAFFKSNTSWWGRHGRVLVMSIRITSSWAWTSQ